MISVTLTYPPSANRLWRAVNGRNIKSAEYRAWLAEPILSRKGEPILGKYHMTVCVDRPDKRRRDLSNLLKPLEDKLQAIGAIADDCNADNIDIGWATSPLKGEPRVVVVIVAALSPSEQTSGEKVPA